MFLIEEEYGFSLLMGTQAPNLMSNSLQEEKDDVYLEGQSHIQHEGFKNMKTTTLEVHKTTPHIPFELVYGFNPLSPLDLLPLLAMASIVYQHDLSKAHFVTKLHEKARMQVKYVESPKTLNNSKGVKTQMTKLRKLRN
ncbi:hypothetical protein CR513_21168, partial [Mucuna pruriens]